MPVQTGHWKTVVPKKKRRAGLDASVAPVPAFTPAFNLALAAAFALALATSAQAQSGVAAWTDLGVKWPADNSWGKGFGKSPSRMQADEHGNLYVSQKDSLYIGTASGSHWKAAPIAAANSGFQHIPVALGFGGAVMWGTWISADWGATWKNVSAAISSYYTATAIAPAGYCLFGGSYDVVERAAEPGAKPDRVHMGNTFGNIIDIAVSAKGMAYASPEVDELLISRDGGKTWVKKQTLLKSDPASPYGDLASGLLALDTAYPEQSLWMASGILQSKNQTVEYVWSGDSLSARHHANSGLPDSSVTSLRVQRGIGTVLWLGTWGQGAYRSLDKGETWKSVNSGLTDLHIEAMAIGPAGQVYALTPKGLFLIPGGSSALSPRNGERNGPSDGRAYSDRAFGTTPRYGNSPGLRFQADGRYTLPASFTDGGK